MLHPRVDRAIAAAILEAVSDRAIEATVLAAEQGVRAADDERQALTRELEAVSGFAPELRLDADPRSQSDP